MIGASAELMAVLYSFVLIVPPKKIVIDKDAIRKEIEEIFKQTPGIKKEILAIFHNK